MQNFNWIIDLIQNNKKTYVDLFVKDDDVSKLLHEFVDKQTELCYVITKNYDEISKKKYNPLYIGNLCKK